MTEVHYENLVKRLSNCPAKFECSECPHLGDKRCMNLLLKEASEAIKTLQDQVNAYSKYDGFLWAHGFFRNTDEQIETSEYVTTISSTTYTYDLRENQRCEREAHLCNENPD